MGRRRSLVLAVTLFVVSRAVLAWLAIHRGVYHGQTFVTGDVALYQYWADQILHHGASAYRDAKVQYPPASLPFMLIPEIGGPGPHSYLVRFVSGMALVDVAGLAGLALLVRRGASTAGLWLWVIAIPALGPLVLDRVDLPVAVLTLWGLVAAELGAGAWAGGAFGVATAAKLYPVLLVPELLLMRRPRVGAIVGGFAAGVVVCLAPFVTDLDAVRSAVLGYHSARGIQAESNWGIALLTAQHLGYPVRVVYEFGSFNVLTAVSGTLKRVGETLSLAVAAAGAVAAWMRRGTGTSTAAGAMFATLALVMSTGTVLSPQYVVWLIAPATVAATLDGRYVGPAALLVPIAGLSQVVYPFFYGDLLAGDPLQVTLLAVRNLALLAAGAWAGWIALSRRGAVVEDR